MSDPDLAFMREALSLAAQGQGAVEPNPMVGCLIVRDGEVIGRGFHQRFGGPHAEVEAIASVPGGDTAGATAYVTLEPCCHHGKTPPCTDALLAAGINRVVVAMSDPFAKVDGGGLSRLTQAGVDVTVGVAEEDAKELNAPYLKRVTTGRPWVIAKWAMTADGKIATTGGESQWITGDRSRRLVHQLRGRVDAVMVGMGTVLADDPLLNARPAGHRTAKRVVFCRRRLPPWDSQLIATAAQTPVLLMADQALADDPLLANPPDATNPRSLRRPGVEVHWTSASEGPAMVAEGLAELGRQGMTNVMVEGGGQLLASFAEADEIDECHVYLGPKLFGGESAPGPIGGAGHRAIAAATPLNLVSVQSIGDDIQAIYRKIGRP